jgi:hypothetical protein
MNRPPVATTLFPQAGDDHGPALVIFAPLATLLYRRRTTS